MFTVTLWLLVSAVLYLAAAGEARNQLLVLLVDGLRWDTVSELPALEQLAEGGARAEQLRPCFPTDSYPNYYCVATGLYSESHGMVANNMYDVKTDETFKAEMSWPGTRQPRWWNEAEPIWITAKKKGLSVRLYHWPGCDVKVRGVQLSDTECVPYTKYMDGRHMPSTLDRALDGLAQHDVDFVMVYQEQPDGTQHQYGVNSTQASVVRARMDASIHRLAERAAVLQAPGHPDHSLLEHLNFMVLSDHGHVQIVADGKQRTVDVTPAVNMADVHHAMTSGATYNVWPKEGKIDQVYESLKAVPHLTVYLKADLPDRWHYKHSPLVAPVTGVADVGHLLITPDSPKKAKYSTGPMVSTHGFDNAAPQMAATFVGAGPNFRPGARVDLLENVQLYQVMCSLLGLAPGPHNGSWDKVAGLLRGFNGQEAPTIVDSGSASASNAAVALTGSSVAVVMGFNLLLLFGFLLVKR